MTGLVRDHLLPDRLIGPFLTQRRRKGGTACCRRRGHAPGVPCPPAQSKGDGDADAASHVRTGREAPADRQGGAERIREVRALLDELPDYRNGPYADLRKSLLSEIEDTRTRSSAVHRDSIAVRREGAAQIALVGPPNVGKSSLLQALSEIQIRTGDYAFTTLRPVPALTRIGGVLVQLVEIPGLIEAPTRIARRPALLGVLRLLDAIVYCARADGDPRARAVLDEVAIAGIEKPAFVAATRADEAPPGRSHGCPTPSPA
jgi:hypothetical protein